MSGFIRRYLQDPGLAELLAIEGVVIIDREPAASIIGTGSGTVCLVAEFEKGPYTPQEVMGGQDVLTQYGAFGFVYNGVPGNFPCARSRNADAAAVPEYWNGNGYVALAGKSFSRLILCRVDTTVGEVSFTRLPYILGNANSTWTLAPAATLVFSLDGAANSTATFNAAVGNRTGTGVYPSTFVGGETLQIMVDGAAPVVVTFTSADQSKVQVISRINASFSYAVATDTGGNGIKLSGVVLGTAGSLQIGTISGLVATATGLTAGITAGTGNVGNILAVTAAEVATVVTAASSGTQIDRDSAGNLRIASKSTTGTPSIKVVSTSTAATIFGFAPLDTAVTAIMGATAGTLSAGIEVTDTAGTHQWVTAVDVAVTATSAGPYKARIRPATDDGTVASALPAAITTIAAMPVAMGLWAVTNTLSIAAALTEPALDAAYLAAFDATRNLNSIAKQANIIVSARQSNAIRNALRSNALLSSANGMFGRVAVIRPPLGTTTRAQARSDTTQPGVGAYRDQRVVYAFPGGHTFIPAIAKVGVAGGAGFTADGTIDVGSDTWLASIMSQLPPEENPGQETTFATNLIDIEQGNPDVLNLTINDYEAFKAAGIAALRIDDGTAIVESGVTSVNPAVYPGLKNIARRRMADFIQDSLSVGLKPFTKKLNGRTRRGLVIGTIDSFLKGLKSDNNADAQRIEDWSTDYKSGNTPDSTAAGLFRCIIKVRTLPSMDVIVLDTEIGEGVLVIKAAA
jgi:hypothetical protein